jgi:hypothetical protein
MESFDDGLHSMHVTKLQYKQIPLYNGTMHAVYNSQNYEYVEDAASIASRGLVNHPEPSQPTV